MCSSTVILAQGASEWRLGTAGQVALRADWRDPGDPWNPRDNSGWPLFMRRLCTCKRFDRNWMSYFFKNLLNASRQTKATSIATKAPQSGPRAAPRDPTGTQCRPKERKGVKRHSKETMKLENYTHINEICASSRDTAIQRPASMI